MPAVEASDRASEFIGFRAEDLGPIEVQPTETLGQYQPKWVWPPSFRNTWHWRSLKEDIASSGIRTPLVILPDGRVIDGGHRLDLARELGILSVPVRVAQLPLPLSDDDRLRIEAFAILDACARRQLTPHQAEVMVIELEAAAAEVDGAAIRRSNLRRGSHPGQPLQAGPTAEALAQAIGISPGKMEELLAIAHKGTRELHERMKNGELSVWRAYQALRTGLVSRTTPRSVGWQEVTQSLSADGHAIVELGLDCSRAYQQWPLPTRAAFLRLLARAADRINTGIALIEERLPSGESDTAPRTLSGAGT